MPVQMNNESLRNLISNIASVGRQAFGRGDRNGHGGDIDVMCRRILEIRGEASAVSLAKEIIDAYAGLSEEGRLDFFYVLLIEIEASLYETNQNRFTMPILLLMLLFVLLLLFAIFRLLVMDAVVYLAYLMFVSMAYVLWRATQ